MSTSALITIDCMIILLASLAGGWAAAMMHLTHRRMQIAISFVAGVMLGIGLLHLLPHSALELGSAEPAMCWAMAGFLVTFFLERFFHFHHHEGFGENADHSHAHDDHGAAEHDHPPALLGHGRFSWAGAAAGLTLHGLIDGAAVAAAVIAEQQDSRVPGWAGIGALLAVALHKPFDSLAIGTLMAAAGQSPRARHVVNVLYALVVPCGALALMLGADQISAAQLLLGRALGVAAGTFLCIATSDLLPELQFHSHDRIKLSLALMLGVGLAWSVLGFENTEHEHGGARQAEQPAQPAGPVN